MFISIFCFCKSRLFELRKVEFENGLMCLKDHCVLKVRGVSLDY